MVNSGYLIAPSSKINKRHLENAKFKLSLLGLNSNNRKDILSQDIYFAGSVKRRTEELNEALTSNSEYIFAVKGGYAIMELFSFLNWDKILSTKNKTIMGFSDISALLLALTSKNYSGILVHGPNMGLKEWEKNSNYVNLIKKVLSNKNYSFNLKNYNCKFQNKQNFSGRIIGGNLRIISLLYGTNYEIQVDDDSILFVEDVRERPAALYSMLLQLELTGKLKNIKALLIGSMVKCGKYLPLLEKFLERLEIPIIYELPIGHVNEMFPIRLNSKIHFDSENNIIHFDSI